MKKADKFYLSKEWKKKRLEVLRLDKYKCQHCKARGILTPATTVHHRWERREFPQYQLDIYVEANGRTQRNLISLCRDCHEAEHNRFGNSEQLTEERW